MHSLEAFLGSIGSPYFASNGYASRLRNTRHGFPCACPYTLTPVLPLTGGATFLRHPITWLLRNQVPRTTPISPKASGHCGWLVSSASPRAHMLGYGNINPFSIDYACRPRLRSRLTLGGTAWPRNPWSSGGRDSHSALATHACILTPTPSTVRFRHGFPGRRTLPYPPTPLDTPP